MYSIVPSALNKQYDHVRQITCLKQFGCAIHFRITNEVASLVLHYSLVLRIFIDQEIFFIYQFTLIDG